MTREKRAEEQVPHEEDTLIKDLLRNYQEQGLQGRLTEIKQERVKRSKQENLEDRANFEKELSKIWERYSDLPEKERKIETKANFKKWLNSVPAIYREASLKSLPKEFTDALNKAVKEKGGYKGAIYIYGPRVTGKTWSSYAIIRSMVFRGLARPSKILVIDEGDIRNLSYKDFDTKQRFLDSLKEDRDVFLIDDVSDRSLDERQEDFYREVLKAVYTKSKDSFVIFTSSITPKKWISTVSKEMEDNMKSIIGMHGVIKSPKVKPDYEPEGWDIDTAKEFGFEIKENRERVIHKGKDLTDLKTKDRIEEAFGDAPVRRRGRRKSS